MTAKEILNKVKAIFEAPMPPMEPAAPTEPASQGVDCTLPDGRIMNCNPSPEVGAVCTIDGQPAPDGEYDCTLPDGSKCVCVCKDGVCVDVRMPEPVTTDVPPAPTFEERLAKIEEALAKLTTPPAQINMSVELSDEVKEAFESANAKIAKQDEVIKGLFELAEKLAEQPTAEPKTLNGNKKEQFERTAAKEKKFEEMASAITQLKTKN